MKKKERYQDLRMKYDTSLSMGGGGGEGGRIGREV